MLLNKLQFKPGKIYFGAVSLLLLALLAACSSIDQAQPQYQIYLDSEPSGALVKVNDDGQIRQTPAQLPLPVEGSFWVTLSKPGYHDERIKLITQKPKSFSSQPRIILAGKERVELENGGLVTIDLRHHETMPLAAPTEAMGQETLPMPGKNKMALTESQDAHIGQKMSDFTLSDAAGISHQLANYLGNKGVLIAFICNHCPYVKAIADRFAKDAYLLLGQEIRVLAINSNDYHAYPEDSPPKMIEFSRRHSFNFPYLMDEDQSVAKHFDAVCTPDFYGLNAKGELQYRGRLDDAQMGDPTGRQCELVDAMQMIAATGHGPDLQHPSIGCSIKWR